MRHSYSLWLALAFASNAAPALAETPAIPYQRPASSGNADAATTASSILPKPGTPVSLASGVNWSATIVADFTIAVRSDIASDTPIYCSVSALFGGDANPYAGITKSGFVEASRSGDRATCKVSLPYGLYGLLSPSRDYLSVSYFIEAGTPEIVGGNYSAKAGAGLTGAIPLATLPANGRTTSVAVSAIL
jgi:hypothetical protein